MANPSSPAIPQAMTAPVVGAVSISGRSREMEDALCVRPNLCSPEINRRRPLHYFAVFDGHGGAQVSSLCRERMHTLLEEELVRVRDSFRAAAETPQATAEAALKDAWVTAMKNCFQRMDMIVGNCCRCWGTANQSSCSHKKAGLIGSTAAVVVLTDEHIVVANCGDSRAVLSRRGRALPLSVDHKPNRPDELARIEALGGRVIYSHGARVEGILAMSRAIGDRFLRPFVIPEPEVTLTRRGPEDEFLVLGSDGLWDVMPNEMVCDVARECLRENIPPAEWANDEEASSTLFPSQSASAATLLTRLAVGRNSRDNITVIVVDLKRNEKIN
ncbi:PREDICTED: probable protein phosphatase 2C 75 [Ipomoea nil]|uniref:probable protein phosphatase 2C 75 n=1 Tax=Ipomoea nil TaxID=35883 RepID=UPI000901F3A2|nr:PREDICTED: probable protein phosphatase 2C 75 [Ipomoea nil]